MDSINFKLASSLPERWYIETEPGPDGDFVSSFYNTKLELNPMALGYSRHRSIRSHNDMHVSIFDADKDTGHSFAGYDGKKITIEQFKQLVNNHQNNINNGKKNNEVQRNAESIGNTNPRRGITAQSRKCTIAIANGYVGHAFGNKPSKATIIQNRVTGNILVASHN